MNFGISVACGKWIARMDADDVSLPDRFERQLAAVSDDEEIVVLGGEIILMNKEGKRLGETHGLVLHEDILENILYACGLGLHHPTVFLRKDAVCEVGGYQGRFCSAEDIDLWLKMSQVGKMGVLPEPVILNRQHSANISWGDGGRTQVLNGLAARACYFKRRAGKEDPINLDDAEWKAFVRETEAFCDRFGVFRARGARQKISIRLQSVAGRRFINVRKILRLIGMLVLEPKLAYGLTLRAWRKTVRLLERNA